MFLPILIKMIMIFMDLTKLLRNSYNIQAVELSLKDFKEFFEFHVIN